MYLKQLTDCLLLSLLFCSILVSHSHQLNNRPIVGVLLQEPQHNTAQYVASSYVKYLESAGARVIPIPVGKDSSYYEHLTNQINGVLMPGGGTPLLHSSYSQTADLLLELAIAKNNAAIYFPVWGTCLSFEKLITYFTGNQKLKWEAMCSVENLSLNLDFPPDVSEKSTKLFRESGANEIMKILANFNVTANYHRVCLPVDIFQHTKNLTDQFILVSTNTHDSVYFVSTIEHRKYPIYGTMWHPEKNQFEWVVSETIGAINHDYHAILVGQYFGNFLVNEARKNDQHFENATEEAQSLMYNYHQYLEYSGKSGKSSFEEIYKFPMKFP